MGTWGSGIYDNDGALDVHADLTKAEKAADLSVDELAVYAGLKARFDVAPDELAELAAVVRARADELDSLPAEVGAALSALAADPEGTMKARSRSEELREALGGYCDGPHLEALLSHTPGRAVIARLVDRCRETLDNTWPDLYRAAADLAALGVIIELQSLGAEVDPDEAKEWLFGYRAARRATSDRDEEFWEEYDERVLAGFRLLLGDDFEEDEDEDDD
ncbi:MAG: DUF4259 domain-containing protein [Deltaproteobacteria bacterium]|nr:DUF4259 domain-containing protein [Deltaproteobacteria bacterium]